MALALHFDPYAGISAAAALGALLDVGLDADALRAELATLALPAWTLKTERATAGVTGTRATFTMTDENTPLPLGAVRALLADSGLASVVRERSLRVLTRVAAGEWGTARDDDPAGTSETILAVVGTLVGLALLGVAVIATVAPPQGRAGSPVTPAAAALLATVATERPPTLRLRQVGYGLGPHDPTAPHPVAVRVWLGEAEGRDGVEWRSLLAPAVPDATPAAILLVLDHAAEAGVEYERLAALVAAWAGVPARLCAYVGARNGAGPARVTGALEEYATAGARRIVIQRLGLVPDPAVEEGLAGTIHWARGRWPGIAVVPATPLLTARQLVYRLAGRATAAWEGMADKPAAADTAILLVAPGSAGAEANAEAYRVARLLWEGRDWPHRSRRPARRGRASRSSKGARPAPRRGSRRSLGRVFARRAACRPATRATATVTARTASMDPPPALPGRGRRQQRADGRGGPRLRCGRASRLGRGLGRLLRSGDRRGATASRRSPRTGHARRGRGRAGRLRARAR